MPSMARLGAACSMVRVISVAKLSHRDAPCRAFDPRSDVAQLLLDERRIDLCPRRLVAEGHRAKRLRLGQFSVEELLPGSNFGERIVNAEVSLGARRVAYLIGGAIGRMGAALRLRPSSWCSMRAMDSASFAPPKASPWSNGEAVRGPWLCDRRSICHLSSSMSRRIATNRVSSRFSWGSAMGCAARVPGRRRRPNHRGPRHR